LRKGLKGEELRGLLERVRGLPEGAPVSAYLSKVIQENSLALKEMAEMSDMTIEEVLEETGVTARLEARAQERDVKKM
jgi:predicted oxidoreductase